ncbi:hypothetical protein V500_09855 [Pseudogymnoascus sp. VKM F-4518 (FW-2643)]|nr:hypothetical protein V500_09855 [Pseudogymnoascus sp. VKM F-4518 (FW-2643)]
MPPLLGFSDNPFQSRDDVSRAATSLLKPLTPYKSSCGARIKLSTATGTGFDEVAAQLEGFARPLWVVADLLAAEPTAPATASGVDDLDLNSWIRGLEAGVDPSSDTFWGYSGDHDQRMVEMEPIAYALLSAPSVFLTAPPSAPGLDPHVDYQKRDRIVAWLRSINEKIVPPSNWRWFRILVNLALVKSCGVPYDEVKPFMDADFKILDSFYIADGWSSDGLWSADKRQADYYSGSFAIQYSQVAYIRFAQDLDPERVERYRSEAGKFAETFWRYFDVDGAAIPFGRSLTYRFAFAAFWSAAVVAEIPLPAPLNDQGVVKGLLLRHLRWWSRQCDIFNTDGTLNIGYTYPNMFMSEDYNSPQSVYWCLKTFSALRLSEDHPFWRCEELPHPLSTGKLLSHGLGYQDDPATANQNDISLGPYGVVNPSAQITCSFPEHHFLLSAGQSTKKPHRAREAKYSKLAYSSAFAFSVPVGPLLPQMAPDSTLSVSNDDGDTWRARWEPESARIKSVQLTLEGQKESGSKMTTVPVLISAWRPWKAIDFKIETILIPPLERWPGWHVRVHILTWKSQYSDSLFQLVDAGFAISSKGVKGGVLPALTPELRDLSSSEEEKADDVAQEGIWEGDSACLVLSDAGASGIADLSAGSRKRQPIDPIHGGHECQSHLMRPDSNTNLVAQRTRIPSLHHHFHQVRGNSSEAWLITGVFAVASSSGLDRASIRELWRDKPRLDVEEYMNIL